jgi:hypothetical protein
VKGNLDASEFANSIRWFVKCEPPSDAAIAAVLQKISPRVIRTLRRLGYLEAGMDRRGRREADHRHDLGTDAGSLTVMVVQDALADVQGERPAAGPAEPVRAGRLPVKMGVQLQILGDLEPAFLQHPPVGNGEDSPGRHMD